MPRSPIHASSWVFTTLTFSVVGLTPQCAGGAQEAIRQDSAVHAAPGDNGINLLSLMGSTDMAEEVLQQFSLRALSKSSDIKKRDSVLSWLYRVLSSTLADYYRAQTARQHGEAEYARLQPTCVNEFTVDPEAVCTCFYELLLTLKPEYAEVLHRIDLHGESRAIVATDLGITRNMARVRLHRARQALRKALLASCKNCCSEHGFMNCEGAHGGECHGEGVLC